MTTSFSENKFASRILHEVFREFFCHHVDRVSFQREQQEFEDYDVSLQDTTEFIQIKHQSFERNQCLTLARTFSKDAGLTNEKQMINTS